MQVISIEIFNALEGVWVLELYFTNFDFLDHTQGLDHQFFELFLLIVLMVLLLFLLFMLMLGHLVLVVHLIDFIIDIIALIFFWVYFNFHIVQSYFPVLFEQQFNYLLEFLWVGLFHYLYCWPLFAHLLCLLYHLLFCHCPLYDYCLWTWWKIFVCWRNCWNFARFPPHWVWLCLLFAYILAIDWS